MQATLGISKAIKISLPNSNDMNFRSKKNQQIKVWGVLKSSCTEVSHVINYFFCRHNFHGEKCCQTWPFFHFLGEASKTGLKRAFFRRIFSSEICFQRAGMSEFSGTSFIFFFLQELSRAKTLTSNKGIYLPKIWIF